MSAPDARAAAGRVPGRRPARRRPLLTFAQRLLVALAVVALALLLAAHLPSPGGVPAVAPPRARPLPTHPQVDESPAAPDTAAPPLAGP